MANKLIDTIGKASYFHIFVISYFFYIFSTVFVSSPIENQWKLVNEEDDLSVLLAMIFFSDS